MTGVTHRVRLGDMMRELGLPMVAAEIGVAEGNFSEDMLGWGLERLYCVDAWRHNYLQTGDGGFEQEWHDANYARVLERMAKHGDRVVILRGQSWEMAARVPDASLGLVHLDAGHSSPCIDNDLAAWWPKVVPGGIMSGHDYLNPSYDVHRVVDEFARARGLTVTLIPEDQDCDAGFWIEVPA